MKLDEVGEIRVYEEPDMSGAFRIMAGNKCFNSIASLIHEIKNIDDLNKKEAISFLKKIKEIIEESFEFTDNKDK